MTIILSIFLLLLIVAAMSIGVIFGRKPIQGSCGGLNAVGLKGDCEICGGNPNRCESNVDTEPTNSDLAIDATQTKRK